MAQPNQATRPSAPAVETVSAPATAPAVETAPVSVGPAIAVEPVKPPLCVRFAEPSYRGKPNKSGEIARPNVADAVITGTGLMGGLRIQFAGFTLAKDGNQIVVYSATYGGYERLRAVEPARQPAPDGVETDDGTVLVSGAKRDMERFEQSIRDAWADANKTAVTKWGVDIPLSL